MRFVVVVAVLLFSLAGCVPDGLPVVSSPAPSVSPAPVFASEEEALAAAEEAYRAYLEVSDQVANDAGSNPERLEPYVTPEWLTKELEVFERFAATGRSQSGSTILSHSTLQQLIDTGVGSVEVAVYFCVDFSNTRFLDGSGNDVTPGTRELMATVEARLVSADKVEPTHLLIESSEVWTGSSIC